MRDSGYALPTTRSSARSTSPRSGCLFVSFLLRYSCIHIYRSEYADCVPGVNPPTLKSDIPVLGMYATNLMAFFLVSILQNLLYLFYNLKNANPFTFVGYLFIGHLCKPAFPPFAVIISPPLRSGRSVSIVVDGCVAFVPRFSDQNARPANCR